MSEDQDTDQEPSIEEILASIRQIISDDDEDGGDAPEEAAVEDAPAEPEPESAEEVAVSEPEPEPEPEPIEEEPEEDVIELTEKVEEDVAPEPVEEDVASDPEPVPEPEVAEAPVSPTIIEDNLIKDRTENAVLDGFSELARKTAIEPGGVTVEEIVRSELRPLLQTWLDKNLPNMIERLVREELERIAKRTEDI